MTDSDRALWAAAQDDYTKALKIAAKAWEAADPPLIDVTPEALQAAAATILIHITKLRHEPHVVVKVPPSAAPAAATGGSKGAASAGAVPPCKECGGSMEPNPNKAKNEKAPDFVCTQENGKCGKPSKDGKYFNKTGVWIEKPNPKGAQGLATAVTGGRNFNEKPGPLIEEEDTSDLPF